MLKSLLDKGLGRIEMQAEGHLKTYSKTFTNYISGQSRLGIRFPVMVSLDPHDA
jgi:hypothetical protein